jgi:hypothetical protein
MATCGSRISLRSSGLRLDTPATPQRVWQAIRAAREARCVTPGGGIMLNPR